jgi:hypothetical protein
LCMSLQERDFGLRRTMRFAGSSKHRTPDSRDKRIVALWRIEWRRGQNPSGSSIPVSIRVTRNVLVVFNLGSLVLYDMMMVQIVPMLQIQSTAQVFVVSDAILGPLWILHTISRCPSINIAHQHMTLIQHFLQRHKAESSRPDRCLTSRGWETHVAWIRGIKDSPACLNLQVPTYRISLTKRTFTSNLASAGSIYHIAMMIAVHHATLYHGIC